HDLGQLDQRHSDASLLGEFARGRLEPGFADRADAAECQIPSARPDVLPGRSLVGEYGIVRIEHHHICGPMCEIAAAHLCARNDGDDSLIGVDDLDELVGYHSSTTLMACFWQRCTASTTSARASSGGVSLSTYMKSSSRTSKMSGATCMQMALDSQRS